MVGAVGRVSPNAGRHGSYDQSTRTSDAAVSLRGDGAVAGMDSHYSYCSGDMAPFKARKNGSRYHLSVLLEPLSSEPEALADRLLLRFGSLGALADANEADLRECSFYGERWLDSFINIRKLLSDGLKEHVMRSRITSNPPRLHRYLSQCLARLRTERIVCFFCDEDGFILSEETLAEGAANSVSLSMRQLFFRALALDARRLLLAHNHPSGSPEPSAADQATTLDLSDHAQKLGIIVEDHLIVGRRGIVSMKARGLL